MPLASLADAVALDDAARALRQNGVLFLTDAVSDSEEARIYARIVASHNRMFGKEMHGMVAATVEDISRHAEATTYGCKGFGYLYKGKMSRDHTPMAKIGTDLEYIEHHTIYRDVNLETMLQNPALMDAAVGIATRTLGSDRILLHADTAKVALHSAKNNNPFTPPHMDLQ